ncbi:MAG: HlyC/CorC family transporter, partial [Mailhella sp.]|nr:HlyC/CorC family transporter [Mailhella sp.]
LYSIPWTTLEKMQASGSRAGKILYAMRSKVAQPISAILTLNTIANTAGASLAGALAAASLGSAALPLFAAVFTILVLLFGEIIPKTLGVAYPAGIGRMLALPLYWLTRIMRPFTWLSGQVTKLITPKENAPEATEDDINAMARLSLESGGIQGYEEKYIRNVLSLDQKKAHDVMTPRTVVFSLSEEHTLEDAHNAPAFWNFSRIPIYAEHNEDIVGYVLRRDVLLHLEAGRNDMKLGEIMQPIHFILESITLDRVLSEFLKLRQHLFVVLDEYGGLSGVISLEDVLEELIGADIVDESDMADDLRALARERRARTTASAVRKDA